MKKLAIPVLLISALVALNEIAPSLKNLPLPLVLPKKKPPVIPVDPVEPDKPAKPKPKRPWGNPGGASVEAITLGGTTGPNGTLVQIDFPLSQHIPNIGSTVDGAGMCVMSSIEMGARWQNLEVLRGLREWCAKQPGGGYPTKVDKQLKEYFALVKSSPGYIQYEGTDTSILRLALSTGRFPSVTYAGRDGVRYQSSIAHMVCLCHLDENLAGVWDNNGTPGEIIWMSAEDFKKRWTDGGNGWAFVWIAPPPPPVPVTQESSK